MIPPSPRIIGSTRTAWFIAACVLAAVLLIGNSDLVLGKATPIWDADAYYAPMFSLVADYAKAGKLLLWNPWMNGGSPDFADPQAGTTSPFLLAFALLVPDPMHGFIAYWITMWIAGGIGMLLLCRHLGCPTWGGLVAALGFVACGFYTGHGEHTSILYSFSLLPWIIWRFDAALTHRSYWYMVQAGTLWGLSALGGYPALVIIDSIFLALWALGRWFAAPREASIASLPAKKRLLFLAAGMCLFGVIGAAVMAPPYVGFLKYTRGYTTRVNGITRDYALQSGPLPPQALGTIASPSLYLLNWPPYVIWPETDISNDNIYMGSLVLALAVIALLNGNKWRLWLGVMIVFSLSCAVGNHLPVRGWLYDLFPPTRYFRFPALFSGYAIVVACILAGYGSQDINIIISDNNSRERTKLVVVVGMVALVAAAAYFWILRTVHLSFDAFRHPSKLFVILWLSILVLLFLWSRRDVSTRLLLVGFVVIAIYDASSALKISIPTMYSGASTPWWKVMSSKHVESLDLTSNGLARQLYPPDELGGRYQHNRNVVLRVPVFANDTGMVNQFFQPYVADSVLNQLAVGTQRTWFSAHPIWSPSNSKTFDDYVKVSHTLGIPPLILHSREEMMTGPARLDGPPTSDSAEWIHSAQPVLPATIELVSYSPDSLAFRYNAAESGWLLVSDRWAPDWIVTVNGHPAPIAGANFLFRGIPVSQGENTVLFLYQPRGYLSMVILSWLVIVLVVAWEVVRRRLLRARSTNPVLENARS